MNRIVERLRSLSPPLSSRGGSKSPAPKTRDFHAHHRSNTTITSSNAVGTSHCRTIDCKATLLVEGTKFIVCKHQLAHAADFFRELFSNEEQHTHNVADPPFRSESKLRFRGSLDEELNYTEDDDGLMVKESGVPGYASGKNQYSIVVGRGSQKHPAKLQFQWFLESVIPNPVLRDITDDILEPLMRLSQRFGAAGLRIRCSTFIKQTATERPPMVVILWLSWCLQNCYPLVALEACLPVVCRLPLVTLEEHRHILGDKVFGDLVAAKLRASYDQAVSVYQQIHSADHFSIDLYECPRCHQRPISQQAMVQVGQHGGTGSSKPTLQVQCSPCHRMIGCDRCMRQKPCICDPSVEYEAVYHCKHGARMLSDKTMDCHCQSYKLNLTTETVHACEGGIYSFTNGTVGLAPLAKYETM